MDNPDARREISSTSREKPKWLRLEISYQLFDCASGRIMKAV
jgi:hypothetical protein